MCGIAGYASPGPLAPLPDGFLGALDHRGPDGRGHRSAATDHGSWTLLHTRLAIVDLSAAGNQPMADEDGTLHLSFNGEIYNHRELRRYCEAKGHRFSSAMDGEVILHLWEMEGPAALARLNGIFALAVADSRTGEVFLARDPLGVKPLHYSTDERGDLWFASELDALQRAGAPVGTLDTVALAQFLSFLWIPDPRTPLTGVRTVPPGHAMHWRGSGIELFRFGDPLLAVEDPPELSPAVAVDLLRDRLCAAVERQLLGDVPIGLMASGGVDSSLVWWAAAGEVARGYTIAWPPDRTGEGLSDDARTVARLQQRLRTEVSVLPGEQAKAQDLPPSGDLFADPAYELTRYIARAARTDGLKVLLSGQGGDELFGGYRRHAMASLIERLRLGGPGAATASLLSRVSPNRVGVEYVARLAKACAEPDPFAGYMQLCTYSTGAERARELNCSEAEVSDEIVWQRHREVFDSQPSGASFLRKVMAVDLAVYLPGLGLSYVDRAGMEFGVEIRVPWLDLELVRWTLTLPDPLLVRGLRGKRLPRDLAAGVISPEVAHRAKRGFAAPASQVNRSLARAGRRGFRQGSYFARAATILNHYRARGDLRPLTVKGG
ncbi:MAG: asparagine synthase (glutamine-hydrolyzing) [Egibacteraceae bacterium]